MPDTVLMGWMSVAKWVGILAEGHKDKNEKKKGGTIIRILEQGSVLQGWAWSDAAVLLGAGAS